MFLVSNPFLPKDHVKKRPKTFGKFFKLKYSTPPKKYLKKTKQKNLAFPKI